MTDAGSGRRAGRHGLARGGRAAAHRALLHPPRDLGGPARGVPARRPRGRRLLPGPLEPRQGRPLHPRRELHRAPARGRCTSRTGSSPGRRSRPTTRRSARTGRSTSPAAARAAPRSPGTPTRPPGCATRTPAACCVELYREAKARLRRPGRGVGRGDRPTRRRAAATSQARGKGGLVRVSWDEAIEIVAAAHVHTIKTYGPDRVAGLLPDPGDVDGQPRRRLAGSSSWSAAR